MAVLSNVTEQLNKDLVDHKIWIFSMIHDYIWIKSCLGGKDFGKDQ